MSLLFDRSVLHLLAVDGRDAGTDPPRGPGPGEAGEGYVLVYNPPDQPAPGHGQGWTLTTWQPGPRPRAVSLAARGAGAHAGPRVAKAVAVRVLAEHGVPVAGWCDPAPGDEFGGLTMFRARLGPATDPPTEPPTVTGSASAPGSATPRIPTFRIAASRPRTEARIGRLRTSREDRSTP